MAKSKNLPRNIRVSINLETSTVETRPAYVSGSKKDASIFLCAPEEIFLDSKRLVLNSESPCGYKRTRDYAMVTGHKKAVRCLNYELIR